MRLAPKTRSARPPLHADAAAAAAADGTINLQTTHAAAGRGAAHGSAGRRRRVVQVLAEP